MVCRGEGRGDVLWGAETSVVGCGAKVMRLEEKPERCRGRDRWALSIPVFQPGITGTREVCWAASIDGARVEVPFSFTFIGALKKKWPS